MYEYQELTGTYGGSHTPCTVFVAFDHCRECAWYVVEDSVNVNCTYDIASLADGVDVEELADCDFFTASETIESLDDLEAEFE